MKVFEVGFKCNNCGNNWTDQFEKGSAVKNDSMLNCIMIIDHNSHPFGTRIYCPICEADDIQVISRIPLKDKNRYATSIPEE
jgi:transposase-like protein